MIGTMRKAFAGGEAPPRLGRNRVFTVWVVARAMPAYVTKGVNFPGLKAYRRDQVPEPMMLFVHHMHHAMNTASAWLLGGTLCNPLYCRVWRAILKSWWACTGAANAARFSGFGSACALSQLEGAADPMLPAAGGMTCRPPSCETSKCSISQARRSTRTHFLDRHA